MSRTTVDKAGAFTALLGIAMSLFGMVWDVQWHVDVGPDTFFTLSHLLLYSGSAVAGIASLTMVLRATADTRAGREIRPESGGLPVRVLGVFTAPLGYLVAGLGAALFLTYGLIDLGWHAIYGFDAVLGSPPHVALFITITITMVGTAIVFTAARGAVWGRVGLALTLAILIQFSPLMANGLEAVPLPIDTESAATVFFAVLLVLFGRAVLGRPGDALAIAAAVGLVQLASWWYAPWAAHSYADFVGLPLRDNAGVLPYLPERVPMFLLLAAAVLELVLWLGRTSSTGPRWVPQLAGLAGGLITAVSFDLQHGLVGSIYHSSAAGGPLSNAVVGMLVGALTGFLAWRLAAIARTAPVPAAAAPREAYA